MIELKKTAKPQSLINNGDNWTKDLMIDFYQTSVIDKTKQNKYNKPDIKQALIDETNEKCAYCESKVTHIYPGDIEHIIPKSLYPRLTFSWNNLTFGCFWCNNKKRDFLSKECMILNPYKDKINTHLRAFGPIILHINNSKRGEITWRQLELNRTELRDKRLEKIEELKNLIDKLNSENIPALKSLILNEINDFINRSEYSFTLKQFFEDNKNVA
ncbi:MULTISPECIES: HNH endonuclease [Sphingobacterium]|uniref:HNH endonuclease n=1 Tax=Sphingobacterium TaxID=28453 RepID=UPI0025805AE3|nr:MULTISPECIES: HNH endonuclease [Sphingobacterium]